MANVAKVLKAEIARISRKEINSTFGDITRTNTILRKTVAGLKKRIATLEKDTKRLSATVKRSEGQTKPTAEEPKRARLTSKGIRALRKKLKLTRPAFAKLVGTSPQSVYMWETKEGLSDSGPGRRCFH